MSRTRNLSTTCPCCAFLPDDLFLPSSVERPPDDATSVVSSSSQILEIPSPGDAWSSIQLAAEAGAGRVITIVDTRMVIPSSSGRVPIPAIPAMAIRNHRVRPTLRRSLLFVQYRRTIGGQLWTTRQIHRGGTRPCLHWGYIHGMCIRI